jgi:hypothetical protein
MKVKLEYGVRDQLQNRLIYLKDAKQRCSLSPLLFNICVYLLIPYLRKAKDLGYRTNELANSVIQAYADDMILVSDSEENLQIVINRAKTSLILPV